MKNILIVCVDKELRKDLSKAMATQLKCLYLDVDDLLNFEILNQENTSLKEANNYLQAMESKCINRALEYKNCIITISHELFVSNDNFNLIKDVKKIFIFLSKAYFVARTNKNDRHKLEQELCLFDEISFLIKSNCDIVIEKGIKTIEQLSQEIIENLQQKNSH